MRRLMIVATLLSSAPAFAQQMPAGGQRGPGASFPMPRGGGMPAMGQPSMPRPMPGGGMPNMGRPSMPHPMPGSYQPRPPQGGMPQPPHPGTGYLPRPGGVQPHPGGYQPRPGSGHLPRPGNMPPGHMPGGYPSNPGGYQPHPGGHQPNPGSHPYPGTPPRPGGYQPHPGGYPPVPGGHQPYPGGYQPRPPRPGYNQHQSHWGGNIGGHWIGGMQAPGGWNGYHRPRRGYTLPSYWIAPSFFIGNYATYGLSEPPYGYRWSRYYDDAVLVNGDGQVWDSVNGIDWSRGDTGYDDGYYDDGGYDDGQYPESGYDGGSVYDDGYTANGIAQSSGGFASAGGSYAYAQGGAGGSVVYAPPAQVVQPLPPGPVGCANGCGGTVVNGWYYPPASTTTVTIQSVPVTTTTTTTEYIEETESVRYTRPHRAPRRATKYVRRDCGC